MKIFNQHGQVIMSPRCWHIDDALDGDWYPAIKMLESHSVNDPFRDVRVAIHQLIYEIREKYSCDNCERITPLI